MKKKLLILLMGLLLLTGCKKEVTEVEKEVYNVTDPILIDEGKRVVTEEIDRSKEDTPVKSFYLEYIFEDNFCVRAIYHTKYKVASNTDYNLTAVQNDPAYENAYIDDNGYLVYDYLDDELIGKSVRNVLISLQFENDINVEVYDE